MKEQLSSIQRECDFDPDNFYNQVIHSTLVYSKMIPINNVLYKYAELSIVSAVDDQKMINAELEKVINRASSSSVSGVVASVLGASRTALFGKKELNYTTEEGYSISIGLLGGVERMDYRFVKYSFSDETWSSRMEHVVSLTMVVSVCKIEDIKDNVIRVMAQNCFSGINKIPENTLTPEKKKAISEMKIKMEMLLNSAMEESNKEINLDELNDSEETLIKEQLYEIVTDLNPEAKLHLEDKILAFKVQVYNKATAPVP